MLRFVCTSSDTSRASDTSLSSHNFHNDDRTYLKQILDNMNIIGGRFAFLSTFLVFWLPFYTQSVVNSYYIFIQ